MYETPGAALPAHLVHRHRVSTPLRGKFWDSVCTIMSFDHDKRPWSIGPPGARVHGEAARAVIRVFNAHAGHAMLWAHAVDRASSRIVRDVRHLLKADRALAQALRNRVGLGACDAQNWLMPRTEKDVESFDSA